jgi:hypothetical protein
MSRLKRRLDRAEENIKKLESELFKQVTMDYPYDLKDMPTIRGDVDAILNHLVIRTEVEPRKIVTKKVYFQKETK